MEAGVRAIPWLAAPTPGHIAWGAGGLIASTRHDWHVYLRQLVMDLELRQELGRAGRQRAEGRELSRLGGIWERILGDLLPSEIQENLTRSNLLPADNPSSGIPSPILNTPIAAPSQQ
jgi:hypothetical protein